MFCQMIEKELELNERIVLVTEHFVGMQPFASPTPFCTHIYPRRQMASFGDISGKELIDLGPVVRTILAKLYYGLQDPDFNLTVRTAPAECVGVKYFHWYLSIHSASDKSCRLRIGFRNVYQYGVARNRCSVPMQCESRRHRRTSSGKCGSRRIERALGFRPKVQNQSQSTAPVPYLFCCISLPNTYSFSGPKRRFST
jgi:diadenosine tetraphosphate (Ap4A) HIT family hydrolase